MIQDIQTKWVTISIRGTCESNSTRSIQGTQMKWVTISIKGTLSVNRICSIRGTLSVRFTCSKPSYVECAKHAIHVSYTGLLAALPSPPMPCSIQHNASAWLGWTIAPVSRLKTLPPSATGTPGVGFWRGGCPESKPHFSSFFLPEKKECEVSGQTNLKFQSFTYKIVEISDREQRCSSASQCVQSLICCDRTVCCQLKS